MKKKMAGLLTVVALITVLSSVIASAYTIDYTYAVNGTEFTSPYSSTLSNFQVLTFNNVTPGDITSTATSSGLPWTWTGNASVVNGSLSGMYAAPYGLGAADTTNYLAVPNPNAAGQVNVQLGKLYNYFGLWWGSVDSYNTLSFYNGKTLVASVTGADAVNSGAANGNQTVNSSNLYVNLLDLPYFDSFELKSSQYAFETDNLAVGDTSGDSNPVPEPSTFFLFGIGILGALVLWRRKNKV